MNAPTPDPAPHDDGDAPWQALPPRARGWLIATTALGLAVPLAGAGMLAMLVTPALIAPAMLVGAALGALIGAWLGNKRYRHTHWRCDRDGFALRRGRLWRTETRVPGSRVQHLDLKRGPLQRRYRLATLVIHTAGTRHGALSIAGLDQDDAERLRDQLARQTDDDDDDGDGD